MTTRPAIRDGVDALRPVFDGSRDPLLLEVDDATLRVQLCLSPHCTTLASLLESTDDGWWSGPPDGWRRIVRDRSGDLDLRALAPYTAHDRFPGFMTSSLRNPAPAFEDQVEEIRATPDDRVAAEVRETFPDGVPATYAPFVERPREATEALCAALLRYWDVVVRPSWPTIRPFLEREILRLGYSLATRGAHDALNDVHPAMRLTDGALHVTVDSGVGRGPLRDRGLMLTPLVTDRAGILADLHGPENVKIGYAAPGAQEVWMAAEAAAAAAPVGGQLGDLLGTRRAEILGSVARRSTTTALSRALRLSPGTVSEHLTALARLGLVDRIRVGRSVYYGLTERGEALIALFSGD